MVMPLIGGVDEARAAQIQASLLAGIERYEAREVILDLTGVPVVDAGVAALVVGEEHVVRPVGLGQRPQGAGRVDERVTGVDEDDVGLQIQRTNT